MPDAFKETAKHSRLQSFMGWEVLTKLISYSCLVLADCSDNPAGVDFI